jgi:hypothetical protein
MAGHVENTLPCWRLKRLLPLLAVLPTIVFAVEWSPTGEVAVTWNDNVTNASAATDRIGTLEGTANVEATTRQSLTAADAIFSGAHLNAEWSPRFEALTTVSVGPQLRWQHKFGLGPFAPVVFGTLALDVIAAHDAGRRGAAGSVALGWRKRFAETAEFTFTEEFARTDAREAVYDRSGAQSMAAIEYTFTNSMHVDVATFWRHGDVLSYATPPRPDLVALAPHRVTVDTFGRPLVAYSIDADTIGARIAVGRSISADSEISLGYEYRETKRAGFRYLNQLVSVTLEHQF